MSNGTSASPVHPQHLYTPFYCFSFSNNISYLIWTSLLFAPMQILFLFLKYPTHLHIPWDWSLLFLKLKIFLSCKFSLTVQNVFQVFFPLGCFNCVSICYLYIWISPRWENESHFYSIIMISPHWVLLHAATETWIVALIWLKPDFCNVCVHLCPT